MKISDLNLLNANDAETWFMQICTASKWCQLMTNSRPYTNKESLIKHATTHWQSMTQPDYLEAFQGHPMIGDVNSLREKYAATKVLASNEQAGAAQADEETLSRLHSANHEYLNKNGFIFIICATGLSAQTMLVKLEERLGNSSEQEMQIAAAEQLKISLLRIDKALSAEQVFKEKQDD